MDGRYVTVVVSFSFFFLFRVIEMISVQIINILLQIIFAPLVSHRIHCGQIYIVRNIGITTSGASKNDKFRSILIETQINLT